jgi:exosortase
VPPQMGDTSPPASISSKSTPAFDRGSLDLADVRELLRRLGCWCVANPLNACLLAAVLAVVGYFYFGLKAFMALHQTAVAWLTSGWNAENDQEHCWGIFPVAVLLVLIRWREIAALPKKGANSGLWFVALGVFLFVVGVRCAEARYTVLALPPLVYGITRFLHGIEVSRVVLFPCIFLLFMMPVGGVVQGTVPLQVMTGKAIQILSSICGIPIVVDGSSISSPDGRFEPMEIAGGCSGIRSLMAMSTLAALYAYFTMRGPVRGLILFGCSLVFAVLGNFARVFSVVLFARFIDAKSATTLYHDYSGLVFFPVAVGAMVGMGSLLNRDWESLFKNWFASTPAPAPREQSKPASPATADDNPAAKSSPYDY